MAGKNEANLADKKTPEKPKRGQYQERECPHSHAMTQNLGNQINKGKSNDKNEDNTGNLRGDNYPKVQVSGHQHGSQG